MCLSIKNKKNYALVNFIIAVSLFCFSCNSAAQDNIARDAKYSVSIPPNYPLSAPPDDTVSLTNGIYSSAFTKFWTQKTTVGWQIQIPLKIVIDLGANMPVSSVSLSTVRGEREGVKFPSDIFVFTSSNEQNCAYAGDAVINTDNETGATLAKKFKVRLTGKARYIYLVVVPAGNLFFCDEIEVTNGKANIISSTTSFASIKVDNIDAAVDSLKSIGVSEKVAMIHKNDLQRMAERYTVSRGQSPSSRKELGLLSQRINNVNDKNKVLSLFAAELRKRFAGSLLLRAVNPWDTLHPIYFPENGSSTYTLNTLINGVQYGGIVVTNISDAPQKITSLLTQVDGIIAGIEMFTSPFITINNFTQLPDPLVLVTHGGIKLEPGESRLFFMKVTGKRSGNIKAIFKIKTANSQAQLPMNINVYPTLIPANNFTLSAIDWGYSYFKLVNDRKDEAVKDQLEHHINTEVVPSWFIPKIGSTDFTDFKAHIVSQKFATKILLFVNYAGKDNRAPKGVGDFMGDDWKRSFINWYRNVLSSVREAGFPTDNLFLYPYDEVQGEEVTDFKEFAAWAKGAVPGLKIYATLANKDAIRELLPLLDIAQIKDDPLLLKELPFHKGEVWTYSVLKFAKSLSPYTIYRLMAWRAFVNDYKGIGFWGYADIGKISPLDIPLGNSVIKEDDYAVVYQGPGKSLISSRRWEAFRLGIEDYQVLLMYANKEGLAKAKKLAALVLNEPGNCDMADNVRNQIFKELK
ncbi:MAG: hypothetical protein ABIU30_13780 [Ferruginibacter sp.]